METPEAVQLTRPLYSNSKTGLRSLRSNRVQLVTSHTQVVVSTSDHSPWGKYVDGQGLANPNKPLTLWRGLDGLREKRAGLAPDGEYLVKLSNSIFCGKLAF